MNRPILSFAFLLGSSFAAMLSAHAQELTWNSPAAYPFFAGRREAAFEERPLSNAADAKDLNIFIIAADRYLALRQSKDPHAQTAFTELTGLTNVLIHKPAHADPNNGGPAHPLVFGFTQDGNRALLSAGP